jgi:hypothetical protein
MRARLVGDEEVAPNARGVLPPTVLRRCWLHRWSGGRGTADGHCNGSAGTHSLIC